MLVMKRLTERGDTIVEVLISIAVISLILGGAYVTTNKSLQGSRAAQERTNATKLVEGQIEAIKDLSTTDPNQIYAPAASQFCINLANETAVPPTNGACTVNANGAPTAASSQPAYKLSVSRQGDDKTFIVTSEWDAVTGNGKDRIVMTYRIPE